MSTKPLSIKQLEQLHQRLQGHCVQLEAVGSLHASSGVMRQFSHFASNVANTMKSHLSQLYSRLFSRGGTAMTGSKYSVGLSSKAKWWLIYESYANKYKYGEVTSTPFRIPTGFKGNFGEYAKVLAELHEAFMGRLVTGILQPMEAYLGKVVNQPQLLESQRPEEVKAVDIDLEKLKKPLSPFVTSSKLSESTVGKAFQRMNDFITLKDNIIELIDYYQGNSYQHLQEVQKATNNLDQVITLLLKQLEDKSNLINSSEKAIKVLTDELFQVAKAVELYSTIYTLTQTFLYIAEENAVKLSKSVALEAIALGIGNTDPIENKFELGLPEEYHNPVYQSWLTFVIENDGDLIAARGKSTFDVDVEANQVLGIEGSVQLYRQLQNPETQTLTANSYGSVIDFSKHIPIAVSQEYWNQQQPNKLLLISGETGEVVNNLGQRIAENFDEILRTTTVYRANMKPIDAILKEREQTLIVSQPGEQADV